MTASPKIFKWVLLLATLTPIAPPMEWPIRTIGGGFSGYRRCRTLEISLQIDNKQSIIKELNKLGPRPTSDVACKVPIEQRSTTLFPAVTPTSKKVYSATPVEKIAKFTGYTKASSDRCQGRAWF